MSNARRCRSVIPPQTPNSTRLSSASAPHSAMTGQCRQTTAALRCAAPRTKSSSGSEARQRACDTHAMRASAAAPGTDPCVELDVVLRGARRLPDTSVPHSFWPPHWRAPRRRSRYAIYATLCRLLLPISHCHYKLGGQVSFAQQFGSAYFGTTVPSGRYALSAADVCESTRASRMLTRMPITLRKPAEADSLAPSSGAK